MDQPVFYSAQVKEVYSADDMLLMVNLGVSGIHVERRARLFGVDAPNAFQKASDSEEGKLRDSIRKLLRNTCKINIVKEVRGDLIVTLYYEKNKEVINLNEELIAQGFEFKQVERNNG